MHTGSLMSRCKALLKCEQSLELSNRDANYQVQPGFIEFKDTDDWKQAYHDLKKVLKTREHWTKNR